MSDFIDRKNAIDVLEILADKMTDDGKAVMSQAIAILKDLSTAEPERKKGKWQRRKDEDCWECSECHAVLENSDVGNHNFYYCYHCGANMMDICGYMDLEKANYERPYQQTGVV